MLVSKSLILLVILLLIVAIVYIVHLRRRLGRTEKGIILLEDLMKRMFSKDLSSVHLAEVQELWKLNREDTLELLDQGVKYGWLIPGTEEDYNLSEAGYSFGLQITRAHRMYEKYLAEKTGYTPDEWHEKAEVMEHHLKPHHIEKISAELSNPFYDPHGSPIPMASGEIPVPVQEKSSAYTKIEGKPLWELADGEEATITGLGYQLAGDKRKRLLDLGFVKGSKVKSYLNSPTGAAKAYLVRDTAIALRRDQAMHIYVS